MKLMKIDKNNIDAFAEEMFQFNCANEYGSHCFSTSDIMRERMAFCMTDIILEQLDKAGFDMTNIPAFKTHNWNVDDLTSPVTENPVLIFKCFAYENYLTNKNVTEYFTENTSMNIVNIDELLK